MAKSGAKAGAVSASQRGMFLDVLALKANVTAAAKAGGITTAAAYRLRMKDAGFRAKWHEALCEGYARIETELVAEALKAPSALTSDAMLKARAQKERLRLALLTAHRAAVRGERAGAATVQAEEVLVRVGWTASDGPGDGLVGARVAAVVTGLRGVSGGWELIAARLVRSRGEHDKAGRWVQGFDVRVRCLVVV